MVEKIIKSKKMVLAALMAGVMSFGLMGNGVQAADKGAAGMKSAEVKSDRMIKAEKLQLTQEWDKVFPKSDKVDHRKVTFVNRYGITLAADMYVPRNAKGKLPALAVSGPFGAVKEQSSGLYAQEMAERGYLTIAFDPSFTGESGGQPRYVASPDINTEDFSAAVDFLSTQENVDKDRIGIIGICGWGGMALNAAASDTRIKAAVASTMYDMSRVIANGYFDRDKDEATLKKERYANREALNAQRTEDYKNGFYKNAGGVPDVLPEDAPWFVKDYYTYYKTERRCSLVCEGLLYLLQDGARLPSPLPELQRRLESDIGAFLHEYADSFLCRRNQECCAGASRRKGPFPLLWRRCLQ